MTPEEENLNRATGIAESIFSMDYYSAQLRLVHTGALRQGEFRADDLKNIHSHLKAILTIAEDTLGKVVLLAPTITIETEQLEQIALAKTLAEKLKI